MRVVIWRTHMKDDAAEPGVDELYAEYTINALAEIVPVLEEQAGGMVAIVGHAIDNSAIMLECARALKTPAAGLQLIKEVVQDTASGVVITAEKAEYVETKGA